MLTCRIRESSSACAEDNGTGVVDVVVVDLIILDVLCTRDVLAVLAISDENPESDACSRNSIWKF